mmetsp:Transcript_21740/g.65157  ORF Transcript_21740/g.65157 Transcript_21740/m.65157 type:complete len:329 (-) Transcript_21740:12-998(-)
MFPWPSTRLRILRDDLEVGVLEDRGLLALLLGGRLAVEPLLRVRVLVLGPLALALRVLLVELLVEVLDLGHLVVAPDEEEGPVEAPDDQLEARHLRAVPEERHHEEEEPVRRVAAAGHVPDEVVDPGDLAVRVVVARRHAAAVVDGLEAAVLRVLAHHGHLPGLARDRVGLGADGLEAAVRVPAAALVVVGLARLLLGVVGHLLHADPVRGGHEALLERGAVVAGLHAGDVALAVVEAADVRARDLEALVRGLEGRLDGAEAVGHEVGGRRGREVVGHRVVAGEHLRGVRVARRHARQHGARERVELREHLAVGRERLAAAARSERHA